MKYDVYGNFIRIEHFETKKALQLPPGSSIRGPPGSSIQGLQLPPGSSMQELLGPTGSSIQGLQGPPGSSMQGLLGPTPNGMSVVNQPTGRFPTPNGMSVVNQSPTGRFTTPNGMSVVNQSPTGRFTNSTTLKEIINLLNIFIERNYGNISLEDINVVLSEYLKNIIKNPNLNINEIKNRIITFLSGINLDDKNINSFIQMLTQFFQDMLNKIPIAY